MINAVGRMGHALHVLVAAENVARDVLRLVQREH